MATSAAARPLVSVFDSKDGETNTIASVPLPAAMTAPIRPDVVTFVHSQVNKNRRQAYCVKDQAGMDYSAESWGTGRAVSRIPRIGGGGTHRSAQGAFGNMCRGGRMFHPTRIWRKWHKKVNQNQRRYALCSSLAASSVPSLVSARGHKVSQIPELPLVIGGDHLTAIKKTKEAVEILARFGVDEDVQRVQDSRKIRAGKGKMRNRRYVKRRGPLIVHASTSADLTKAFRNIEGVDLCHVDRLNVLQLAPGGHLGRLVVWTKDAFEKIDKIYGTATEKSTEKVNYSLPRSMIANADVTRIINSEEIQKVVRPIKEQAPFTMRKKNALKNLGVMVKLNPYALAAKRAEVRAQSQKKSRAAKVTNKRQERAAFYKKMME